MLDPGRSEYIIEINNLRSGVVVLLMEVLKFPPLIAPQSVATALERCFITSSFSPFVLCYSYYVYNAYLVNVI